MKLEYISPVINILYIEEISALLGNSITSGKAADGTPTNPGDGGATISTDIEDYTGNEDDDEDPIPDGTVRAKGGMIWDEW